MRGISFMFVAGEYAKPRLVFNRQYWRVSLGVIAFWVFFFDMEKMMARWQKELKEKNERS